MESNSIFVHFRKGLLYFKGLGSVEKEIKTVLCYTGTATQKRSNGIEVKPWYNLI